MAYGLFLPRRWTRQPQGPVEIDRSGLGGAARFLVHAPSGPRDLHRGDVPTGAAWNPVATSLGIAHYKPTTSVTGTGFSYPANPTWLSLQELTVFAIVHETGGGNSGVVINRSLGSATASFGLGTWRGTLDGLYCVANGVSADDAFNNPIVDVGDAFFDRPIFIAATISGGTLRGYTVRNGVLTEYVDTAALGAIDYSRTDEGMKLLRSGTGNSGFVGYFYGCGVLDLALPAAGIAALAEHPYQTLKPRRPVIYSFPSGGATHELTGDATAGASAAGSLTTGIQLDGDASAAATASGNLTTGIPLAGDADASAQASGTLSTEIRLAAAALVSATATGSLSTAINLAGSAASATLADGTLTTQIRLAGAAIAGAVADAGLSTQILLDAAAQAGVDASGDLTTVPSGLAGDAVAGATASGALSVQIILAGDALAAVLASGDLTTAGAGAELAADATVLAIASGGLTTAIQLTGAPVISVTASGELSIGLGMTAEALATVSAAAVLSTQIRMEGAALASALAAGSLSIGPALGAAIPHTRRIGRPRTVFGARRIGPERVTFAAGRIGRRTMIGD